MAFDGIYMENSESELTFLHVGPPNDAEAAPVAGRIHRRVMRLMERRGMGPDADSQDTLQLDEPLRAELYRASISGRVATGLRAGRPIVRVGEEIDSKNAESKSDVKILEDSVHLTAPARDFEYVSALALGWPVKPGKAEATYENGLLRIEVPFKDPLEDAVKVAIKAGGAEARIKTFESA
jgi:hypothetical protein